MLANVVGPTARVSRSIADALKEAKGLKKGGMVKKPSSAMGRAVKRKTADVKGRAMKKGK